MRLTAKNRNIDGYKNMSKDRLLRIVNNSNKRNRNSIFKLKRDKIKKSLYKPTRNSLFKLKRKKEIKTSLYKLSKKKLFK